MKEKEITFNSYKTYLYRKKMLEEKDRCPECKSMRFWNPKAQKCSSCSSRYCLYCFLPLENCRGHTEKEIKFIEKQREKIFNRPISIGILDRLR